MHLPAFRAALLAATVLIPAAEAEAQQVGRAGAVNPSASGSKPTRVLELGSNVVFKERIATTGGGTVQLIFVDKTTMSVGPNSSVVIDEFVYDPNAGSGRLAASMAKGVLRVVGGNTSHTGGAEIKTPTATLGIRGGVATVEIVPCTPGTAAECGTRVTNHFGILSVTSAAGTEIIRRPGFVVSIPGAAAAPTAPRKVTQAEVNRTNATLTSKPGQTGGAGAGAASESVVARVDVAGPLIAQIGSSVASVQAQTQARETSAANLLGLATSPTDLTTPTQISTATNGGGQLEVSSQVGQAAAASTGGNESNPIGGPASPQAFALAYTGTLTPASILPGTSFNSPILGFVDGGTTGDPPRPNTNARTLQGGLGITGEGASQSSTLYVAVGNTFVGDANAPVAQGGFTGSRRGNAAGLPRTVTGDLVASGANVTLDSSSAPTRLANLQPGTVTSAGTVTPGSAASYVYPSGTATALDYRIGAERTTTPAGLGATRPSIDSVPLPYFGGFAAGLVTTVNNTTNAIGTTSVGTGLLDLTLDGRTSQFGTTIGLNSSNSEGNALTYALIDFGKPVNSFYSRPADMQDGRGTYVDLNNFGAIASRGSDGGATTEVNGSRVQAARGTFVTADTVNAKASFPGVTFCQCEYTRWGLWSSETQRTSSGQSVTDLVHLGTWVFGDQTRNVEMPTTGTATYAGHAIASIKNGTAEYVAAGNFQNAVNFGTGQGAVTVSNLDGRTYTGTVAGGVGSPSFGGTLNSSVPGSTMNVNGLFYRGLNSPAGEMGGTVAIGGTPGYVGAGIFAAAAPR